MGNWSKLKADEKVRVIKFARLNGVSDMKTIRDTFNMYADGGDLGAYNTFVETLPDNMKHTDPAKYDMYRYWELNGRPKDFEEAKKREMFHKELDGYYHASTLSEVTNSPDKHYGTLEFIKAKNHNTIGLEIGAYLKDKNHPMRNREYILDYTGDKARYRPRTYSESILPEGSYVGNIPITALYKNGGPLTHKKSTGGPLYPFSFEKNPFLKTPIVRYDEGGYILPEVTVLPNETYISYTGEESKAFVPTLELYREYKANEIRRQALNNMNNTFTPNVPLIDNDPNRPGSSCLYTFLDLYPVPLEMSNREFRDLDPEISGFKIVDSPLPGDGIQVFDYPLKYRWGSYIWPLGNLGSLFEHGYKFPSHMTMYKGLDSRGVTVRGSNGSRNPLDTTAIKEEVKPISFIYPENADIYRFAGTRELQELWELERLNRYDFGGWLQGVVQNIVAKTEAVDKLRQFNASLSKGVSTITDLFKNGELNVQNTVVPDLNTELPINLLDVTSVNSNITELLRVLDLLQLILEENKALEALRQDMGHMQVLDRDDKTYFREKVKEQELEEKRINWKELSKQEIKEKQRELAEAGFYDTNISYKKDTEKVKELQRMLVKKGLLDNSNGKAIDGIVGKNTQAAYNEYIINKEADGIVGKRTLAATDKYYKSLSKGVTLQLNVSAHDTEWCAEWVNKTVNIGTSGRALDFGVTGNAWNMFKNISDAGGEVLYNAYDMMGSKPVNTKELKTKTESIISNKNTRFNDYSSLQIGDIIGLYMPSSDWHETTLKTGSTYNTHVGVVTGFSADGMPIIEDNIHKRKRSLRADDPRLRITVVGRPAYTGSIQEITPKNKTSQYEISGENDGFLYNNESSRKYADSIASVADSIGEIYNKANMDEVQKIALGILGKETLFGMDTSANSLSTRIKHNISKYIQPEEDVSSEFVRFKLGGLNGLQRDYLGIHSLEDLNDPEKAGRAVALILARNYDYFERLSEEYPKLGITKEDIRNLTILSYNQGMGKLYHIGFDGNGDYAPQELEMVRALANYGTQDGHEGYIKGVNRIIQNRISIKK